MAISDRREAEAAVDILLLHNVSEEPSRQPKPKPLYLTLDNVAAGGSTQEIERGRINRYRIYGIFFHAKFEPI